MVFKLIAYDALKSAIRVGIQQYLKEKGLDPTKIEEAVAQLDTVERRIQCTLLLKAIALLDKEDPQDDLGKKTKTRNLNAMAYLVYEKVGKPYEGSRLSPERSQMYKFLNNAFDLKNQDPPNHRDLAAMYKDLENFLRKHTYVEGNPVKGYLSEPEQSFNIKDYSVTDEIKSLKKLLCEWKCEAIDEAKKLEDAKHVKPSSGILGFGSIFGALPSKGKGHEEMLTKGTATAQPL